MLRTTAPPTPACTLPPIRVAFIAHTPPGSVNTLARASDCPGTPRAGRANNADCGRTGRPGTAVPVVYHATAVAGENSESLPLLQLELLLELRVGLGQCFLGARLALEIGQPRRKHGAVQA